MEEATRAHAPAAREPRAMFRAILDHSSELVVVADAIGSIRYASPSAAAALGHEAAEHLGTSVLELLHPDEIADAVESLRPGAGPRTKEPREVRLRHADGSYRWFEIVATDLLHDPDVEGIVFHGRDLTERHEQQRRLRVLFEQSPIPSAMVSGERGVLANHAFAALFGYSREELRALTREDLGLPEDHHLNRRFADHLASGEDAPLTIEKRYVRKDRSIFWGRSTVRAIRDANGAVRSILAAIVDITVEREALEQLEASEARFRAIVDNSTDIIAVLHPDGQWTASDAGTRQLGYPKGFDPEGGVFALVHPDDMTAAVEALTEVLDGRRGPHDAIELRIRDAAGGYHHYECVGQNLGDDTAVGGVVITARNVDRRKSLETQLARDATHDALTGLLNRAAFMVRLDRALAQRDLAPDRTALLFLDLDRFKVVNDTLGHAAGDALLIEIAARLQQSVRSSDTVARLGGDEFVVLCEELDSAERALDIAGRIVAAVEERVVIGDREAFVGASVGVAFANPGQTASDLMRDSDAAVYRAKREGRSRVERFDDAMRADTAARVQLELDLRYALDCGALSVEYEPVVTMENRTVEAFVAHPRWDHPERGPMRGSEIHTLADESGLGRVLGRQLLAAVTRDVASWRGEQPAGSAPRVFLSPTPRHLADRSFIDDLESALAAEPVVPGSLCLGIPEEWLVDASGVAAAAIARLRSTGVRLALDGFGRAHASLADLRALPIDVVRLDPRFVFGLAVDAAGATIVSAVIRLARALHLRVLADGVDEPEHLASLFTLDCDYATGSLIAPRVDAGRAAALLDATLTAEGASIAGT